jgi:hypothetical protein
MKKRDFLKTTGAALGGMAISGITSVEVEAQSKASRVGSVSIRCERGVKLESIQRAVALAVGRVGCTGCGLLGVDLRIGGGDPEPFGNFNVPGINGASFTPMG